jgi:hypothetical protein
LKNGRMAEDVNGLLQQLTEAVNSAMARVICTVAAFSCATKPTRRY